MMGSALALRRLLSDSVRIFSQPMQLARILDQMEALNCDRDGDIPAPEPVVVVVGFVLVLKVELVNSTFKLLNLRS